MKFRQISNRLMLIVALAFMGFLLVYIPPKVLELLETVERRGPIATYIYFGVVGTGGLLLLISSVWIVAGFWRRSLRKRRDRQQQAKNPSALSVDQKQRELDENLAAVLDLHADPSIATEVRDELKSLVQDVEQKRDRNTLEIVAFGSISSGKSSLLNALAGRDVFPTDPKGGTTVRRGEVPWPGQDRVVLVDTPGLGEVEGAENIHTAAQAAKDADLVLVVVDGPLRESEFTLLSRLGEMEKRVVVCVNKGDWYGESERATLIGQIAEQTGKFAREEDIVAVRSAPVERPRIRVLANGEQVEEMVESPPDISLLAERMMAIVRKDGRELLLANLLLRSRGMIDDAQARVRASLDRRAWQMVDRYCLGAGGAAALSPLPLLDLAAGSAITTKMVVDLAGVYRQPMDAEAAINLLSQLGKNLIAILGVSAATPAVTSAVASLLKTVPGAGTVAGGAMQGLVQAVVTRWIGAVFIEYFKSEMQLRGQSLAEMARKQWEHVTSIQELRKLVVAARDQLADDEDDQALE